MILKEIHIFMFLFLFWGCDAKQYKLKLISLEKCKLPESKMDPNNPVVYYMSARKVDRDTTYLSMNVSVKYKYGPVYISFRGYQIHQTTKDMVFRLNKISCHNPVTYQLIRVLELKLDKDCNSLPVVETVDNINIQNFAWLFAKAMIGPGIYSYDLEFSHAKGVTVCSSITCDLVEIK